MSGELSLVAVALDDRVDLRAGAREDQLRDRSRHRFVYAWGDRTLYLFAFGAAVLVGADAIDEATGREIEACAGRRILAHTIDPYRLSVDLDAPRPRAEWEGIVVPRLDDDIVEVCATALARSAAMERYEHAADPLLDQALALARQFAGRGRSSWGTGAMTRRLGTLAVQRLELARWLVPLDRPELAWDDPSVDRLYGVLADHLELDQRHTNLMHRIASLETSLSTIANAWEGRRSRALEWAIVWLIVAEIGLALAHW